jgi:nitrogen fixation-related uncharacterized protein
MFKIASTIALCGWLVLLASPWFPKLSDSISGLWIPLALSVGYTALIMVYWGGGQGGFDTLDNVIKLFGNREIVLAGWIHYLAFDLFVGAWEARTARAESIPFVLVIPCLFLTFMFGPVGFLLFAAIRAGRSATAQAHLNT